MGRAGENTKDTKGHQIDSDDLKKFQKEISDKLGITKEAEDVGKKYAE